MQAFTKTLDYIASLTKFVQEEVNDSPSECPTCLAEEHMEKNATILAKDLYAASRENPVEAFQALRFVLAQHAACDVVLTETLETFVNLHEETFAEVFNDVDGN